MQEVYFSCDWGNDKELMKSIARQTPDNNGEWEKIKAVENLNNADYHIAFNRPSEKLDSERLILFCMEPPANTRCEGWSQISAKRKFSISELYKPQRWWVGKGYDYLKQFSQPSKTKDLSWITTDKGLNINVGLKILRKAIFRSGYKKYEAKKIVPKISLKDLSLRRSTLPGPYDGHILRMDFLDRLASRYENILDLYGRGDFTYSCYKGEVSDKWDGLENYRYSLAIDNYKGPNYFSEKITDALLSWCMPIYWGCTNLDEFLPEDSYIWIDIEDEDAPERVREIVESDLREQNLDAIAEARRRLLDKYQIWPTVEQAIDRIEGNY